MDTMKKIRSKHNNLLNYFIHDPRDLSPAYVRSCEKFFRELGKKRNKFKASSAKQQAHAERATNCRASIRPLTEAPSAEGACDILSQRQNAS